MQLLCSRSIFTLCAIASCICMCTHTYMHINMIIYILNHIYIFLCFFLTCLSSKSHKLTKTPVLGLGTLASGWWSQEFKRLPKPYRLLLLAACQNLKVRPCCWGHHELQTQGTEGTELELAGSLLPKVWLSEESKVPIKLPREESNTHSQPAIMPMNRKNEQLSKLSNRIQ